MISFEQSKQKMGRLWKHFSNAWKDVTKVQSCPPSFKSARHKIHLSYSYTDSDLMLEKNPSNKINMIMETMTQRSGFLNVFK